MTGVRDQDERRPWRQSRVLTGLGMFLLGFGLYNLARPVHLPFWTHAAMWSGAFIAGYGACLIGRGRP